MKRTHFFIPILLALASFVLFSGQMPRPYQPRQETPQQAQRPQTQQLSTRHQSQRPPQQPRQTTPPRPTVTPAAPPKSPTVKPPAVHPTTAAPLAAESDSTMPSLFWLPDDIQFPEMRSGAVRNITLFGDPRTEGLYTTRTLIPKGTRTIPHRHPDSRIVTVLSGTCYYGRGEEFNEEQTIPMPAGSFFTEPAGIPHFIWAKDDDVVLQTTGIGPSGTEILPVRLLSTETR